MTQAPDTAITCRARGPGIVFPRRMRRLPNTDLLILDELGLRPMAAIAAEDLHQLAKVV